MSTLYSRTAYSPYSKPNAPDNEQLPLRTKAFSQIDNTVQHYSQSQYTNPAPNQDKITEIKKKYEKLLSKSGNKSNQENAVASVSVHEFGKSVSNFDSQDENSRWTAYNRSYQTPTTNKERRNYDPYEQVDAKNLNLRPYGQRQPYNPSKTEVKSQLESNRVTLNAMKNELQSKLNDLSAKTTGSSVLRNPSSQPKQPEKKPEIESTSYEAILSKYSKNISQNRGKSINQPTDKSYTRYRDRTVDAGPVQRIETLQAKIKETVVSNYMPKYTNAAKTNTTTIQRAAKEKQLSTISQISNSNHSENPPSETEIKDHKEKIYEKYRKIESSAKQNAESSIFIEKPVSMTTKPEANNWFRNTTSYIDSKAQQSTKFQQANTNMEFTLQKLESSEGFSITRTVTEQNFVNMNKLTQIQSRLEHRQKQFTAISTQAKAAEPMKRPPTPPTASSKPKEENIVKESQKNVDQKSEIQMLKEKYSNNSSKYTNPYREKKVDVSATKYGKESTPNESQETKIERQTKAEPRNNAVISKEIEKLDLKIKQIEQNKKDLNINFRPYEVSKSIPKVSASSQTNQPSGSNVRKYEPTQKINESASGQSNDRSKYNARYQAYLERVKPLYSEITLSESEKPEPSSFAIKLMPVEYNNDEDALTDRSSQVTSKSRMNEYKNKVELENRTDTGIEERKKRLQDKVEMANNIKNLVKAFGQQAVYDEAFRNNKIWFASERDHKWIQLKKELNSIGVSLSQSDLKNVFSLDESENNPFFSVSDSKCNMKTLAQSYKQAQRHWEDKLIRKFNRAELEKQGFSNQKIDYDKKGFIQVEDLVRFLNIQSGSFLRNRDVSIIFKRLSNNGNKLQFNQFLAVISE